MAFFDDLKKKYTELLSPVKQSLSDNKGWFQQGQFTPQKQVQNIARNVVSGAKDTYYQAQQNAWSPQGILGGSVNAIQGGINKVSNLPRLTIPQSVKSFATAGQYDKGPVRKAAIDLAFAVPESIANIPRNYAVGTFRTGQELGTAYKEQRPLNLQNLAGGIAPLAESLVDVGTFGGFTVAKGLAKEGAKQGIKQAILKQGAKGAGLGALGGLTYGLDTQYGKKFNTDEVAQNIVGGALLGGTLGGVTGGAGAVASKIYQGYKNIGFPDELSKDLTKKHFIRSENVLVKPRQPKAQVEFNAKVNTVLGRKLDTPVYSDDLKAYINKTNKFPDTEIGMGMTIKSVNKNKVLVPEVKAGVGVNTSSQTGKVAPPVLSQTTTLQTKLPITNKALSTNALPIITTSKNATREQVASQLPQKIDNFVNKTLGYTTQAPTGGTREASTYTKLLRKGQSALTTKVEESLGSENPLIRTAASTLQNFFKGAGMSPERAQASMELRGGMSLANDRAYNVVDKLYKSLGNNKESLVKINAVLDPSLAKTKVTLAQLNPTEKQVLQLIREGLDLVHDTSFANGHISKELYQQNKGKYVPRLYQVTELPPEVNKFVTQGKKLATDLYKSRTDTTDWKIENSLNDPVYSLGKRLAQVETNTAIKKYTDFLAGNERFVSNVERPGFTKLSDSPAYGALSGKYVLNSAAEELKGFFFANQGMQNLYDVFRSYDKMGIRQLQKKLLTVFNPTTNVGNVVSDQVFGWVTGVDPLTLNKNLLELKANPAKFKQLNDYLTKSGITSTDITRTDFVNKLGMIDDLAMGKTPSKLVKITDKVQSFYGGTDDVYKVSAFKSLLDKGFSVQEATRKVADGFQNYANVGKFYDLWAKTPVIGKPFVKFQGDLIRIIKNGAVNNPLGLISFLGTLYATARLFSKASGESETDRVTRENRFGAPMIPGLNIPLTWQTPIGEINVARYISPFFANNETTNIASNMLPFIPNINPKKDALTNIATNINDPLLSPLVNLALNRDFRGKPISDVNETKYQPSTLTPDEKLLNQAKFAGRAYLPPPINSAIDVGSAMQGKQNMYGAKQTVPQAVARLAGIKISDMSPEEVQKLRVKDAQFDQYANDAIDKQIKSVTKQLLSGEITPEQAQKRTDNLQKQKIQNNPLLDPNLFNSTPTTSPQTSTSYDGKIAKFGNQFVYLDAKGDQQTVDTEKEAQIGVEKALFKTSPDNFKDLGDIVLRKSPTGDITTQSKTDYNISLYDAKMTSAKKADNTKTWLEVAKQQLETLNTKLNSPSTDELDKLTIQNKIDTLSASIQKTIAYGGFKKPKKPKKVTSKKLKTLKLKSIKIKKIKMPKIKKVKKLKMPKRVKLRV